nr:AI-2E family transporter [Caldisalinibacter kiritimatiensis]
MFSFIAYKIINNPTFSLDSILKVLKPFIWAFAIAYLLNPIMSYLEKDFKLKRIWSISIVYIFFLGLLALILVIITPRIIISTNNIIKEIPSYVDQTQRWIAYQQDRLEFLGHYRISTYIQDNLNNLDLDKLFQNLSNTLSPILEKTLNQAVNFTVGLFTLVLGILLSIYFLKDKEKFAMHTKRLLYAFFDKRQADKVICYSREFNLLFSKYLIGKIIDSIIIGILCFIGTMIIGAPYALVISTIVGVTNMVPYFGPIIGAVPAVLITLFYNPITALWMLIFILCLQQFDGLYLGPKILGTQVGLKPVYVISAIIIGGGLFGVLGMLLAVPIGAIIRTIFTRYIDSKLEEKNIKL